MTITELTPGEAGRPGAKPDLLPARLGLDSDADGLVDLEMFESIYNQGKLLLLASWRDADAAASWRPTTPDGAKTVRHRQVRVIRDYGMFERREAPQYYPEAGKADAGAENPRRAAAR